MRRPLAWTLGALTGLLVLCVIAGAVVASVVAAGVWLLPALVP